MPKYSEGALSTHELMATTGVTKGTKSGQGGARVHLEGGRFPRNGALPGACSGISAGPLNASRARVYHSQCTAITSAPPPPPPPPPPQPPRRLPPHAPHAHALAQGSSERGLGPR